MVPPCSQACRAEADGRALMLLDELGTGTDPVEGAALGVALLKRMATGWLARQFARTNVPRAPAINWIGRGWP